MKQAIQEAQVERRPYSLMMPGGVWWKMNQGMARIIK